MIHLVCYADVRYRHAQERLVASAPRHGVDVVHAFGPEQLRRTPFYTEHRAILDQPRGGGYWLWKPYYILETLRRVQPGDVVVYIDSGAELIAPVAPLVETCRNAGGLLLFRNYGRQNRYWVKRDCYVHLECDTPECYDADQVIASFGVFVAGNADTERFVNRWLQLCTNAQLLTDTPSACGLPELPDFVTHLHDQSLLSLLAYQKRVPLHRDPAQNGNIRKPVTLREPGEFLEHPYAIEPCEKSPYGTLIHHHRRTALPLSPVGRAGEWVKQRVREVIPKRWPNPYFDADDLAESMRSNREAIAEVPTWFDAAADGTSQFGYGMSETVRRSLDRPIGSQPTVSDLIGNLSAALGDRLNYLEIGVSVGKNFWQQVRAEESTSDSERTLTGFDLEEMHPNLASRLSQTERDEWAPAAGSLKRGANSLATYTVPRQTSRVRYLSGDFLDESCWQRLAGRPFNCIYFGPAGRPEWLMVQWRMIERFGLLDLNNFAMVWDDLGGYLSSAFDRICEQVQAVAGPCKKLTFPLRGRLGIHEHPHQVGLLARLQDSPHWLN